ncbi:cysteine desulfuration protein SufE [Prosthecomicrobium pneumaticum]|uniref:Cysteine desulfuration protein SufE n=2 Tax=Prosthecomicrobium pneumaticum TaxID=81895 RepID=A0A7W9CTP1_9HYPH|nr:cysteine desulfuration protein SufE [Prosthecomicrobium pneumaticum]
MSAVVQPAPIDRLVEDFEFLESYDDRIEYLIELGRSLPDFPAAARNAENKVQGCASQVWLVPTVVPGPDGPHLDFIGDSDALIVRGLVAIVLALFSGRSARSILDTDAEAVFSRMNLREHLTAQRSNGLRSMVDRIKTTARAALAAG